MSLPVRLTAGAQHDVEDAIAWYEAQRLGLGEHFLDGLDRLPGDNGYAAFYETVDTILLGRRTYEWILRNVQSGFPYQGKRAMCFRGR